jgi:hypothetical protein
MRSDRGAVRRFHFDLDGLASHHAAANNRATGLPQAKPAEGYQHGESGDGANGHCCEGCDWGVGHGFVPVG